MPARWPLDLSRTGNAIRIGGSLGIGDYRRLLATIHNAVTVRGYQDITLDFTGCEAAFSGPMLALCVQVASRRMKGVDFDLVLPSKIRLRNLFSSAGWAHRIDPGKYQDSTFRGYTRVPAIQFASPNEQKAAVDRLVDAVLCSQTQLSRQDLAAIEWALNEITDNVMNHAESEMGGLVQLSNMKAANRVEFVVSDPGLGICTTVKTGNPEIRSDTEALSRAVREGVTRDKKFGQGNGLFGTFEAAQVGSGYLHVHSGYAGLNWSHGKLHSRSESVPVNGTLVVAGLDLSDPDALGAALRFGGERYEPLDYVETHFELPDQDVLVVSMRDEVDSFGSRKAGEPLRTKIRNLIEMNPGHRVVIDMTDVPLVSSSFADEVFGKLFVNIGAIRFMRALDIRGMSAFVAGLVDRAILQRSTGEG